MQGDDLCVYNIYFVLFSIYIPGTKYFTQVPSLRNFAVWSPVAVKLKLTSKWGPGSLPASESLLLGLLSSHLGVVACDLRVVGRAGVSLEGRARSGGGNGSRIFALVLVLLYAAPLLA